ncbi:hypothetical protein N9K06_01725 [Omnitrophica bacterium]|nr:hypothetical protein [Candidatus Omnitrophota bacterium]
MKKTPHSFFQILTALLPVLGASLVARQAALYAALVAGGYWLTGLCFAGFRASSKRRVRQEFLVLWLLAAGAAAGYFFKAYPYWLAGLFLLFSFQDKKSRGKQTHSYVVQEAALEMFFKGVGFSFLLCYLSLCQNLSYAPFSIPEIRSPFGTFFLLFLAALIWKNQPGRQRTT